MNNNRFCKFNSVYLERDSKRWHKRIECIYLLIVLVCWRSACAKSENAGDEEKDRVTLMQIEAAERERCSSIAHVAYYIWKSAQDAFCDCARMLLMSYKTIYWLIYTSIKPVDILEDTQLQIDRVHSSSRIDILFMHKLSQSLSIWTYIYRTPSLRGLKRS